MYNKRIKKTNRKLNQKGLSLIEVLIVMAITGLTLIALLNLARRDLVIEKLNEEHDAASSIAISQLEALDNIKELNPSCSSTLSSAYPTNNTYFVCQNGFDSTYNASNSPYITPVSGCNTPNSGQAMSLYSAANGTLVHIIPSGSGYSCDAILPVVTSASPNVPVFYGGNIQVTKTGTLNQVGNFVDVQSFTKTYGIDQRFFSTYEDEQYFL